MLYLNRPIAYLQDWDFDSYGNLINTHIPQDMLVLIMIQAGFCGYCTMAKPDLQKFAEQSAGKVFVATIQADGNEPGEKELGKRLSVIKPNFKGYPDYVLYKNGKRINAEIGGRSLKDLHEFVAQYL